MYGPVRRLGLVVAGTSVPVLVIAYGDRKREPQRPTMISANHALTPG
jgi:hypothetical protein